MGELKAGGFRVKPAPDKRMLGCETVKRGLGFAFSASGCSLPSAIVPKVIRELKVVPW